MTALRPEHDAAGYGAPQEYAYGYDDRQQQAYGAQQYGGQDEFGTDGLGAAVDRLADPLNDPLPGQEQPGGAPGAHGAYDPYAGQQGAVQPPPYPQPYQQTQRQYPQPQAQPPFHPQAQPEEWYDPEGYRRDWYGTQVPPAAGQDYVPTPGTYVPVRDTYVPAPETYVPAPETYVQPQSQPPVFHGQPEAPEAYEAYAEPESYAPSGPRTYAPPRAYAAEQPANDETFAIPTIGRAADGRRIVGSDSEAASEHASGPSVDPEPGPEPAREPEPEPGGRAARRRGARAGAPARKEGAGVVVSRFVGELFITFGVVMLLFVTYQLWWTNVRAGMQADGATHSLQDGWAKGGAKPKAAGVFEPGQGFAIMHIPKLDVKVPVAEGIDKHKVLDRGMVGHYADGKLKTAMPGDKQGNFAVAGHRNTHGEPFRYVNRLLKGDKIVVETQDAFYTYEMVSMLSQTSPSNVSVIQPVPRGSGFTKPGRYLTLTTCTPEFTSTYRLIVWGKMVDERPRSKGMPAALDG
ncbi:class E sortase [Streptomyces sp. NPDC091272]|uniref:class E sortase n=1 Tax=Streptomyces sp. NPDC091272 TaxID=3365981 RepID=UPI003811AB92